MFLAPVPPSCTCAAGNDCGSAGRYSIIQLCWLPTIYLRCTDVPVLGGFRVCFVGLLPRRLAATLNTRAPSRGLFRRRRKAPEIYVRRCGEIGERRPYRNRLVELLWIDFVERVVGSVVDIEIIKPVLVQRCHRHAACLQFANIVAAPKRRPAINVRALLCSDGVTPNNFGIAALRFIYAVSPIL
jgi:hypothetical protein